MQEQTRRRVGLMGGTFDPIHIGHLMLAECAYEQFQLEQVLFLPAGIGPEFTFCRHRMSTSHPVIFGRCAVRNVPSGIM